MSLPSNKEEKKSEPVHNLDRQICETSLQFVTKLFITLHLERLFFSKKQDVQKDFETEKKKELWKNI